MKHGERVKERILNAGLKVWPDVTLSSVARAAGFKSHRSVSYHFAPDVLKDAIAEHAIKTGNSRVIVQLVAIGHPAIENMSPRERAKHFKSV